MKNRILFIIPLLFFICISGCSKTDSVTDSQPNANLVILYTNDEHGWLAGDGGSGGAAEMMGLWRSKEGYSETGPYLILSGGDNWTGPAISTWFGGESMVSVMNEMGYDAAAIGNHEFDFKIDGLKTRMQQAVFPYLSANVREKSTGLIPDYITPFIIKTVNGIKVGIIGLSSMTTPWSTFPTHVETLEFINYVDALTQTVPQVQAEGADIIIVIAHLCHSELTALVPTAKLMGIDIMTGGHCHDLYTTESEGIILTETGGEMGTYARIDLVYNKDRDEIVEYSHGVWFNQGGQADSAIANIVTVWQANLDTELSGVIGYADQVIDQYSPGMQNMLTDSWLYTFPHADISMTNSGGIRQSIPAGEILLTTIVGVLPFENYIIELELTGTQVIDCVDNLIVGGMTTVHGYFHPDGTPLVADSVYTVLTTDYLYSRSDFNFSLYDTTPYYTSVNYRQPVVDWIESLNTTAANPLNNYLDQIRL